MQTQIASSEFWCAKCDYHTRIAFNLRRHMIIKHQVIGENIYNCPCGKSFDTLRNLNDHENICSSSRPEDLQTAFNNALVFNRDFFTKKYKHSKTVPESQNKAKNHEKNGLQPKYFVCSNCSKVFTDRDALQKHSNENKCLTDLKYTVNIKSESTELEINLPSLQIQKLPVEKLNKLTPKKIAKTKNACSTSTSSRFQCPYCNKRYATAVSLGRHKLTLHENPLSYKCTLCERAFNRLCSLDSHIILFHTAVRRFYCHLCDYKSMEKFHMKRHLKHSHGYGNSGSQSKSLDEIIENINSISSNEVKKKIAYRCQLCGNVWKSLDSLVQHMKCHNKKDLAKKKEKRTSNPSNKNLETNCNVAKGEVKSEEGTGTVTKRVSSLKSDISASELKYEIQASEKEKFSTVISVETRNSLAIALDKFYKEKNSDVNSTCQLCSITCINSAALENHMKRH